MANVRTNAGEWARRVDEWRRSGESMARFALREGFNLGTFKWWVKQIKRRIQTAKIEVTPGHSFIEITPRTEKVSPSSRPEARPLELVLSRGVTVRVLPGADLTLLRAVVAALGVP